MVDVATLPLTSVDVIVTVLTPKLEQSKNVLLYWILFTAQLSVAEATPLGKVTVPAEFKFNVIAAGAEITGAV
jgi:hypothetical protein